jgi:hypothetical protein
MTKADVIITRHQGLVDLARRVGLATDGCPVLAHASADDVRGRVVLGVLPLHLAAEADAVVSIDLDLPQHLRGTDLSADEMLPHVVGVSVYRVTRERAMGEIARWWTQRYIALIPEDVLPAFRALCDRRPGDNRRLADELGEDLARRALDAFLEISDREVARGRCKYCGRRVWGKVCCSLECHHRWGRIKDALLRACRIRQRPTRPPSDRLRDAAAMRRALHPGTAVWVSPRDYEPYGPSWTPGVLIGTGALLRRHGVEPGVAHSVWAVLTAEGIEFRVGDRVAKVHPTVEAEVRAEVGWRAEWAMPRDVRLPWEEGVRRQTATRRRNR